MEVRRKYLEHWYDGDPPAYDRADPNGWYEHPAGTVAHAADPAQMQADGIALPKAVPSRAHGGVHLRNPGTNECDY